MGLFEAKGETESSVVADGELESEATDEDDSKLRADAEAVEVELRERTESADRLFDPVIEVLSVERVDAEVVGVTVRVPELDDSVVTDAVTHAVTVCERLLDAEIVAETAAVELKQFVLVGVLDTHDERDLAGLTDDRRERVAEAETEIDVLGVTEMKAELETETEWVPELEIRAEDVVEGVGDLELSKLVFVDDTEIVSVEEGDSDAIEDTVIAPPVSVGVADTEEKTEADAVSLLVAVTEAVRVMVPLPEAETLSDGSTVRDATGVFVADGHIDLLPTALTDEVIDEIGEADTEVDVVTEVVDSVLTLGVMVAWPEGETDEDTDAVFEGLVEAQLLCEPEAVFFADWDTVADLLMITVVETVGVRVLTIVADLTPLADALGESDDDALALVDVETVRDAESDTSDVIELLSVTDGDEDAEAQSVMLCVDTGEPVEMPERDTVSVLRGLLDGEYVGELEMETVMVAVTHLDADTVSEGIEEDVIVREEVGDTVLMIDVVDVHVDPGVIETDSEGNGVTDNVSVEDTDGEADKEGDRLEDID